LPALPAVSGHLVNGVGQLRCDSVDGARYQAHERPISNGVVDVPYAGGQVTATCGHCGAEAVKQLTGQVSQGERGPATGFGNVL